VLEICFRRTIEVDVELTSCIRLRHLASSKKTFVAVHCCKKIIVDDGCSSSYGNCGVMIVETRFALRELHNRSVSLVDADGSFDGRVHRDPTYLANCGHGKNVGKQLWVEPNLTKVSDIADVVGDLRTTVGTDP
jgi:hypothetical protein